MKATSIVCIGKTDNQQIVMMATNGEIVGTHEKEHSFFLAEVEDDKDRMTIVIHKNTMRSATEHHAECVKNGAKKGVNLNYLRWDSIIQQKIWAFNQGTVNE